MSASDTITRQSGVTEEHFRIFQDVAQELQYAVLVRLTSTRPTYFAKAVLANQYYSK